MKSRSAQHHFLEGFLILWTTSGSTGILSFLDFEPLAFDPCFSDFEPFGLLVLFFGSTFELPVSLPVPVPLAFCYLRANRLIL